MIDRLFVDLDSTGGPVPVGIAHFARRGPRITTSFRYEESYLRRPGAYALEPALPLIGQASLEGLPGSFQDCSPDRWGRNLIGKRLRAEARQQAGPRRTITEVDYLTEVSDSTRQGALRFRSSPDGEYLASHTVVPPLLELPRLLHSAQKVDRDDPDDLAAVKTLLDAGTGSLGGARPKASVRDGADLLLAKFPHANDAWDVMSWEKTALDLADACGIAVPSRRLVPVGGTRSLLLDRFDRGTSSTRLGYISAMTLVEGHDGDGHDYLDVVAALTDHGSAVTPDLRQLWRRIVFSVLINNTDDHLRNLGFLRANGGWTLAPAFDLNPNPELGAARQTSIAGAADFDEAVSGLRDLAPECRLDKRAAEEIVHELLEATANWRDVARGNGLTVAATHRMQDAFDGQRESFRGTFA